MDAEGLLQEAVSDYPKLVARCQQFDQELTADLEEAGGKEYSQLAALAYRQCFAAGKFVAEKSADGDYLPPIVRPKAASVGPQIQETFAKAYRAGVTIAFGTDCGVSPHGSNALEFIYMVEAGMPELEAIRSATMTSAELLGLQDQLGSISPGKLADIIAVNGNPLEDIGLLQQVSFVMKDGRVVRNEAP